MTHLTLQALQFVLEPSEREVEANMSLIAALELVPDVRLIEVPVGPTVDQVSTRLDSTVLLHVALKFGIHGDGTSLVVCFLKQVAQAEAHEATKTMLFTLIPRLLHDERWGQDYLVQSLSVLDHFQRLCIE